MADEVYNKLDDKISEIKKKLKEIDQTGTEDEIVNKLQALDQDFHDLFNKIDVSLLNEEERKCLLGRVSYFIDIETPDGGLLESHKIFYSPLADHFRENPYEEESENENNNYEEEEENNNNNSSTVYSEAGPYLGGSKKRKSRKSRKSRKTKKSKKSKKSRKGSKGRKSLKRK